MHFHCCLTKFEDVDECKAAALNNVQLCSDNTQCVNTPGSYNCACAPGYMLVNGKCEREFNCMAWNCVHYFLLLHLGVMLHSSVYFTGTIEKAAEVQIIIPSIGQNNSHTFVVQTYDKNEVSD